MKAIRVAVVLLVVIIAFSLCSCRKVEEKIAEESAEKLLEKALGADVEITKDGGKVKVGGTTVESGENLPWPKEAMGDLPKPEGKITLVMENEKDKSCSVYIAEFEPDDAAKYVNKLKEMCIEGGRLMGGTGFTIFNGDTDNGTSMHFQYSSDEKEGLIIYYPEGLGSSSYMANTEADESNYEAGSESLGYNPSDPPEAVKLPENYPEDIFPIYKEDIVTVARENEFETGVEYSLIVESQRSTEEIIEYYKNKWGSIKEKYESVSAKTFELSGNIKDYNFSLSGSVLEEDPKKVEYYLYIMEYDK